jgi:hypothetical protein
MAGSERLSEGVDNEHRYAKDNGCPIVWYVKKGDDPLPRSPFTRDYGSNPFFIYENSETRFWDLIDKLTPNPERNNLFK